MTIEELEDKHRDIEIKYFDSTANSYQYNTKLSIEFAISVLEGINECLIEDIQENTGSLTEWGLGYLKSTKDISDGILEKIQELKQYLDEKV